MPLTRPARVAVVGASGAGKSTLAAAVAGRLGVPHVELDGLWHDPGWTNPPAEVFRERVAAALAGEEWVSDGNYRIAHEVVLARATAVVWLDYPRWLPPVRAVRRTAVRISRRTELWNGNRERWTDVLSREHPVRWAWSQHPVYRARYGGLFADPAYAHLERVRLRSPREARHWLGSL